MRKGGILFALLLLAAAMASAREPESLEQLKARAEIANPSDQLKLSLEIAQHQLKAADDYYTQGDVAKAELAVADIAAYGEKAGAVAHRSRKHLKHTEIHLRNLERRLEALRRTVSFEDRPVLQHAIDRLEKARASLLLSMFGTPESSKMQEASGNK